MSSLFAARIPVASEGLVRDTLVIFSPSSNLDDLTVSNIIKDEIEENLDPQDIIMVFRDVFLDSALEQIQSSTFVAQSLDRLRNDVRCSAISFGANGSQRRHVRLHEALPPSTIALGNLQRSAITRIFRQRKGFVESTPNYHFENPSGKHTDRFLRLSNIISRNAEISFIAFATLPAIPPNCRVIYTDSPSVFPLVSSINDHRKSLDHNLPFIAAENFSSYQVLNGRFDLEANDSIILISASSSGSLADQISIQRGYPRDQIWHVLFSGKKASGQNVIGDLTFDAGLNREGVRRESPDYRRGACAYCDAGSFPIPLFGDQFELPGPQLDAIQLNKSDEPAGLRTVMGRLAGAKVLGVGLGARQSGFARQYNVDASVLGEIQSFPVDFNYVLRRTIPFSCRHVIYLDKPSRALADQVGALLSSEGRQIKIFGRSDLSQIEDGTDTSIVIISAAVESGRSLLDLSRDLRTVCRNAPLVYIIGVNKTNGTRRRDDLIVNLTMTDLHIKHEVVVVENLLLPVSGEGHAWHRERDVLSRLMYAGRVKGGIKKFVEARIQLLSDETSILIDNLFWANTGDHALKVQPGFVYAERGRTQYYSQADVYFTISSVLQRLRANAETVGQRAIRSNWFQQTLLEPSNFARFNDGVIQASLLRAATPRELNFSGSEENSREAARLIRRIVGSFNEGRGEAAAEFLLALASKSIILRDDDLKEIVKSTPNQPPRISLLKSACEMLLET